MEPKKPRKTPAQSKSNKRAKDTKKAKSRDESPVVITNNDDHVKVVMVLTDLVAEIFSLDSHDKTKKNYIVPAHLKYCNNYKKSLQTANCNINYHHNLYKELYSTYKPKFLKAYQHPYWICKENIEIHIGKGTKYEKINIRLKLSMAFNIAAKLKTAIDDREYDNINDEQLAKNDYKYQFLSLLYYSLICVFIDALGEDHEDVESLSELRDKFKNDTHLRDGSDDSESESGDTDSESGASGIARFLSKVTGDPSDSKKVAGAIDQMTSNSTLLDKVGDVFKGMEEKKSGNRSDIMRSAMSGFAEIMEETIDTFEGPKAKNGKSNKPEKTDKTDKTDTTDKKSDKPDKKSASKSASKSVSESSGESSEDDDESGDDSK